MPRFLQDLWIMLRANLWLVPVLGGLVAALFYFVAPPPPMSATMSTGAAGGGYDTFAQKLKTELAKDGFTLHLVNSSGSRENTRRLLDSKSGVQIALVQSGQENELDDSQRKTLNSIGSAFLEPVWLFIRRDLSIDTLLDLKPYRVAIGTETGGTRMIVGPLLEANSLDQQQLPELWTTQSGKRAADALINGELDAAFFIGPPEQPLIKRLSSSPELDLMSFGRSTAYQARLPFIRAINVGEGLLDLGNDTPSKDIVTLAPSAVLAINQDFHPALTPLFLEATRQIMRQGSLLEIENEFPQATPESFPLLDEATYYHKNGLPLLQRYVPFIFASLADRYIILVIPLLVILFPLFKVAGPIYRWRIRARIYRWYKYLREVDKRFLNHTLPEHLDDEIAKLESLQEELSKVEVPLSYSNELYELHLHVRYVIRRLEAFQAEINQDPQAAADSKNALDELATEAMQAKH